jgi:hypothetical protein
MTHLAPNSDAIAQATMQPGHTAGIAGPGGADTQGNALYYGRSTDPIYKVDTCVHQSASPYNPLGTFVHVPDQSAYSGGESDQFFTVWDQTPNLMMSLYTSDGPYPSPLPHCTATTTATTCNMSFSATPPSTTAPGTRTAPRTLATKWATALGTPNCPSTPCGFAQHVHIAAECVPLGLAGQSGGCVSAGNPTFLAALSPTSIPFGSLTLGSGACTAGQLSTLSNAGTGSITIATASVLPNQINFQFGGSGTCTNGQTLIHGESCTVSGKFCPTQVGLGLTATIQVLSSATNSPHLLMLSGDSVAPPPPSGLTVVIR